VDYACFLVGGLLVSAIGSAKGSDAQSPIG
jgi:hypothetical protein